MSRTVVVTGGSKGIGRAVAERFAQAGDTVVVCGRSLEALHEMAASFRQRFPASTLWTSQADLSQSAGVSAFAQFVLQHTQQVDVLVNNAGVFVQAAAVDAKEGQLESQLDMNLKSAFYLTQALVKGMKAKRTGHVFNICSVASLMAYPNGALYSISKFALYGFSQALRKELMADGIKVTSVIPGATWSDSWKGVQLPAERLMPASDVAEMIFAAASLSPASVVEEIVMRPQLGDL